MTFLLFFFRSFNSNEAITTTTSPLPHARVIGDEKEEPDNLQHHVAARAVENNNKPPNLEVENNRNLQSNLAPVMTKGVLGNYELKNAVKSSGPGEDGEGVQLQGEEEKKLGEQSVAEYGFNEVASEKISLDRRARDTRYEKKIRQSNLSNKSFLYLDQTNVNTGIIQVLINYQQHRLFWCFMMKVGQH
jgi:hypothetical protein